MKSFCLKKHFSSWYETGQVRAPEEMPKMFAKKDFTYYTKKGRKWNLQG